MWTGPFSLDWSWLVVLSCHRNFKTSKCRSALSSKNKTFLETALIQSKRRKFIIKMPIISSHKFNFTLASEQARNDWWIRMLSTTKCRWVFLSSDSWASSEISRFPFSLYSTAERTLVQGLAVETKWAKFHKSDFPVVRFVECSLFFFQLVQATFWCPPAAISSHDISQPRVSWKIQKATGYIHSKRFKRARRLHTKGKEQNSSSVRVGTK